MQYEVHWEHKQTKEYNIHDKYATFEEALQSMTLIIWGSFILNLIEKY